MTREYTYDITYKGVSGTITVDTADTTSTVANPGNVNGYGTVTGYAITSITGSFDGQTITGLHDASGTYTNVQLGSGKS